MKRWYCSCCTKYINDNLVLRRDRRVDIHLYDEVLFRFDFVYTGSYPYHRPEQKGYKACGPLVEAIEQNN